jgi:hypothetical protein
MRDSSTRKIAGKVIPKQFTCKIAALFMLELTDKLAVHIYTLPNNTTAII